MRDDHAIVGALMCAALWLVHAGKQLKNNNLSRFLLRLQNHVA